MKHEQKNTIVLLDDEGAVMDSSSLDEHSKIEFYDILEAISSKQREVIILKYIKQMTDIEIAEYLGVTRQSVNRLRNRAVEKIKSSYIEG